MIPMTAARIAGVLEGTLRDGDGTRVVEGVEIDSRRVEPGDCFFAIIGPRDDGHRYLQGAIAEGAVALVVQETAALEPVANVDDAAIILVQDTTRALQRLAAHVRDTVDPLVVAITGSVGKTTTKSLTHALLASSRPTHVTPGNYNNQWGVPLTLLGLDPEHEWMVVELGMSAAGEIAALARLAGPRIGVITNVAPVHMQNFEGLDGVAAAKRELAEELPADGILVVNADDPRTASMGREMSDRVARCLSFGTDPEADVRAVDPTPEDGCWRLLLRFPGAEAVPTTLPLPGEHSLSNFLAAAAVAHVLDIDAETVARRARDLSLPAMRGQIRSTGAGLVVIDDSYNASPTAMMRALDTLAALPTEGRRVLAAGDMLELGSWAEDAHREVGLHAAQLGVDLVITVGPLARDIAAGARAGGLGDDAIRSYRSAEDAAAEICALLDSGDIVLVKGSRSVRMERLSRALLDASEDD